MGAHLTDARARGKVGGDGLLLVDRHGERGGGRVDGQAVADGERGGAGLGAHGGGVAEGDCHLVLLGGDALPVREERAGDGGGAEDVDGDAGDLAGSAEVEGDGEVGGGAGSLEGVRDPEAVRAHGGGVQVASSDRTLDISGVDLIQKNKIK